MLGKLGNDFDASVFSLLALCEPIMSFFPSNLMHV